MAEVKLRNGRRVADYAEPYIVAELNTSHFGDLDTARNMIRRAKDVGCDCVKFQSWSAETLYSRSYYRQNPIAKKMVERFSIDAESLSDLSQYAADQGIDFASTPYSEEEAINLVEKCKAPFIKIASMELDNLAYLEFLGKLGIPLVLSTGMGTMTEIRRAVETIHATGNHQLIILHCTSLYPSDPETVRLMNICGLRQKFPEIPIGYSDHSVGIAIPAAAVGLGAALVEKHFTLDKGRIGMDNQMATPPEEMQNMVDACKTVHRALGSYERLLSTKEREQAAKMRRSLMTAAAFKEGHILQQGDIIAKRPGHGVSPADLRCFVGKQLKRDVEEGVVIWHEDVGVCCRTGQNSTEG